MADVTFEFEGDTYAYDPGTFSVLEGIELKKLTGMSYVEWAQSLETFEAESVRFLVWLSLARAGKRPDVKYREFDFDMVSVLSTFSGGDPDDGAAEVEPDPTPARQNRASRRTSKPTAR